MRSDDPKRCPTPSAGGAMLDVLIALFVLAVGILGITGLNLISKQAGYEATQRTLASALADDLLARMRLNAEGPEQALTEYRGKTLTPASTLAACDRTTPFTALKRATCDLAEWFPLVLGRTDLIPGTSPTSVGGLVDPTVCITGPAGTSGLYTITVAWRGRGKLPDSSTTNTCGQNTYDYQSGDYAFRRLVILTEYISASS